MMSIESSNPEYVANEDDFLTSVRDGLLRRPRSIPPKYFYDAYGSQLFDLICTTPEYYLTRTEMSILQRFAEDMVDLIHPSCMLVELGSGSANKTPLLLRHLDDSAAYVPIDICEPPLMQSTKRLQGTFPSLRMDPICADYNDLLALPDTVSASQRRVVYFPGSTIGNSTPEEALSLLRHIAQLVGKEGALLIGVDCKKSPDILNAAYNDKNGYTAAFNLNLLTRMQRELGAQLNVEDFSHYAYYNAALGRIEMHLVSRKKQIIRLGKESFQFEEGETIHTENSYKYTIQDFQRLAQAAGWYPKMTWTDREGIFSVHYLSLSASEPTHLSQKA